MISKWIWISIVIFVSIFSLYLYQKFSNYNEEIRLYNLQIYSCNMLINTIRDICLESPGTEEQVKFFATKYLKNVKFSNNEIICNITFKIIKEKVDCLLVRPKLELKYYNEGFIYYLFEGKDIQEFLIRVIKHNWTYINITVQPWR